MVNTEETRLQDLRLMDDALDKAFNEGFKQGITQLVEDYQKNGYNPSAHMQLVFLARANGVVIDD